MVLFFRSLQTAIQLGYCKSVPITDVDGVVTPKDIENDPRPQHIQKKGKNQAHAPAPEGPHQFVVKKKRIINKLSKKINQIVQGPSKKE